MKPKTLIITMFCVFLFLGITLTILRFDFTDYSQIDKKSVEIPKISTPDEKAEKAPETVSEAVAETKEPQKYILSYEPDSAMVILTTCFKDGSEIITTVNSINPQFLEPDDVKALTEGIEFTTKEEMFMQIEDYSN